MSHAIHTRRIGSLVIAGLLAVAAVLASPLPASAHDELVGADPAPFAVVDALPATITLTYSAEILDQAGATQVEVRDAAATLLAAGEPQVEGTQVTQELTGAASGDVTVTWRVVSGDGHPIDGTYTFTVTAPEPTATPTPEPTPTEEPTATPEESEEPTIIATPISDDAGSASAFPWIVGGIILLAVGGAVVFILVRARRQGSDDQ